MKMRLVSLVLVLLMVCIALCGCANANKNWFDMTYHFDRAIMWLPDGTVIDGEVESWTDFEDGDQIQVKIDGVTYLTHAENVVLIKNSK